VFASSLDLYETIVSQSGYDNETCLKDKLISVVLSQQINLINKSRESLLAHISYDRDEEMSVLYVSRIHELYSFIEDILIRLNKLKEALLVTERHRSKQYQMLEAINSADSNSSTVFCLLIMSYHGIGLKNKSKSLLSQTQTYLTFITKNTSYFYFFYPMFIKLR
jgi:hypothetical protein